ncbi:nuclear transport factor 2 family protein [Lacisediminihabitans sp.]|uniref:nuclear transport factor 2 family protein n=1 Tax=Lacisediminihabitans sp. TaxID=2787631 RepID=UPI00374DC88B
MNAQETVTALLAELTGSHDPARIAGLVGADYVEHLDERTAQTSAPGDFPSGTRYEVVRVIVDDDMVLTHALLSSPGQPNSVGVDLWKVADDRIVERWSSRTPEVATTASGRSQLDGATVPDDTADSGTSRKIVSDWTKAVLLGGDFSAVPRFLSEKSYAQHNPEVADGIDGFTAATARLRSAGLSFDYHSIDITIAEGDFVFTRGVGNLGQKVVFNDIWRIDGGKIVEHWDVVSPVQAD